MGDSGRFLGESQLRQSLPGVYAGLLRVFTVHQTLVKDHRIFNVNIRFNVLSTTQDKTGNWHGSGMSRATTASPKPSFRASWGAEDAVVGRGNAG